MIPHFVLFVIERAINSYLALDATTSTRLANLAGEIILLQATDYEVSLYFLPNKSQLLLAKNVAETPTLIIRGKLFDILKSTVKDPLEERKANQRLTIEGSMEVAQNFRELLKNTHIDWEEHLARYLGDTIAHQLCHHSSRFSDWGRHAVEQMQNNLTEYLQHEVSLVPSRQEVEDFFSDVHGLQEDAARLAARIDLVFAKVEKK